VSLHQYSALRGSINPADQPPLSAQVRQTHYVGSLDQNIPPAIVREAARRQRDAVAIIVDGFDHSCCWEEIWPWFLRQLELASVSSPSDERALTSDG
jgi:hypothetical protein